MYRVMIIDDEEHIRSGLKSLIDWNSCGYEIIGEADNGRKALAMIPLLKPDLIMVDIQMPEMSGLELIQHLQADGYSGSFMIISAYADFSYAQSAIRYGVKSYLLKPIDERILVGELYSIRKELEHAAHMRSESKLSTLSSEKLTEHFITGLISYEELERQFHPEWDLPDGKNFQVILIRYSVPYENMEKYRALKEEILQFLSRHGLYYLFSSNKMFALLSVNQNFINTVQFQHLKQHLETELHLYTEISIGEKVNSSKRIPTSYQSADSLFHKQFHYGYKGIVSAEAILKKDDSSLEPSQVLEGLILGIEYNSLPDLNNLLEQFKNYMIQADLSEMEIKTEYINLFIQLTDHFYAAYPDIKTDFYDKQGFIEQVYLKNNILELSAETKARLASIASGLEEFHPDNLMEKILYYVDRNYNKNISLTTLSQTVHYNRTYLGRKFKKYTGDYFNNYLDKIRISKSKELLLKGYKIYQVAEMVGYNNVDYYNSKFKKYEHISPSQYKKENGS